MTIAPARNAIIDVEQIVSNSAVSVRITTNLPTVVERTMFFNKLGSRGGHNTIGIR